LIDVVVCPVLQETVPLLTKTFNIELAQISLSLAVGADGAVEVTPLAVPAELTQASLPVVVTEYKLLSVTKMEEVTAPVFHNNEPVDVVDKYDEPLQLLDVMITGVAGTASGFEVLATLLLLHPSTVT
jgi:hypothetical protein